MTTHQLSAALDQPIIVDPEANAATIRLLARHDATDLIPVLGLEEAA